MGNETQAKQQGRSGNGWIQANYFYEWSNTMNKSIFKNNIPELEDVFFTHGSPSDAKKYEDSIETILNYAQQ